MAKKKQLDIILGQGIKKWNAWRRQNVKVRPDLSGADFQEADLKGADLRRANLSRADLSDATLYKADLRGAYLGGRPSWMQFFTRLTYEGLTSTIRSSTELSSRRLIFEGRILLGQTFAGAYLREAQLSGTKFGEANLRRADLRGADLSESDLRQADLNRADLRRANLAGADLRGVRFLETDLRNATVTGSKVFGISVWKTKLNGTIQKDLEINSYGDPVITVDNLEVAQFIYLLINNEKIREVIDSVTSKAVLILGRFTPPRKAVLEGVREELRQRNYLPIVFDFEKPSARDLTETISTLAHMVKFIIADLTEAKSIPQELQTIVPHLPSVPVKPLLMASAKEYGMFEHYSRYPWVLDTYTLQKRPNTDCSSQ
jgi:uncharacterized protein YjbI with pentapeptide repeats